MGIFVLIGGGENGREGTNYETEVIDKEIINLSYKDKDIHFLFLAHGNNYEKSYYEVMKKIYQDKLKCECDLLAKEEIYNKDIVKQKLEWADIVYIGGGNTFQMMNLWRRNGIDKILKQYINQEKVFCGISAGAICWCRYGISDSKITSINDDYIRVSGLNLFNILLCPSYDKRVNKKDNIEKIFKKTKIPMLALESGTALIIKDDKYRVIRSLEDKKIYKFLYENRKIINGVIEYGRYYNLSD